MRDEENRLALIALFMAGARGERCASRLDEATSFAAHAPSTVLRAVGIGSSVAARFGAARALNSMCSACGLCARGRVREEDATVMAPHP